MEIEQTKKRVQKESDRKQEDMDEMKSNYTRKVIIMSSFMILLLATQLLFIRHNDNCLIDICLKRVGLTSKKPP